MLYAYIFLGAGILILSILFRLAAVFRLTIPLLYALVVPTLLSDWYYAHYTLANVIWYVLLAVTVLSWVYSLVRKISAIMERRRHLPGGLYDRVGLYYLFPVCRGAASHRG